MDSFDLATLEHLPTNIEAEAIRRLIDDDAARGIGDARGFDRRGNDAGCGHFGNGRRGYIHDEGLQDTTRCSLVAFLTHY